ncbi:MAG TPA: Rho termination factor N-terminal domain-containing protein, partial [Solirubrobacter sp.]|nr:Rho termination factor N-terminal domain-containing protein [Solirubrobacter sp.]
YRKRLQAIVRRKQKGGEITAPELDPQRTQPVPDLMAALEKSMAKLKGEGALEDLSKDELYEKATDADVEGRSKMTKDQLVEALRDG